MCVVDAQDIAPKLLYAVTNVSMDARKTNSGVLHRSVRNVPGTSQKSWYDRSHIGSLNPVVDTVARFTQIMLTYHNLFVVS